MKFDAGRVEVRKRSRLPHWHTEHGIYFITFNLFDAIPKRVRIRIREEADARLLVADTETTKQWMQEKLDETLDEQHGSAFMRDPRIASLVANAITYFDGERYELFAWSVMPTHVHIVMTLASGAQIDRIVHSWKSYSSKEANKLLGRVGVFWQEDYFDRTIRDSRELQSTIEYVLNNPAKAGLQEWSFVRSYPERIPV